MVKLFFIRLFSGTLKLSCLFIAVTGLNLLSGCASRDSDLKFGLKLYVSKTGNDNWSGKLQQPDKEKRDGPFATIEKARDVIRMLKATNKNPAGNILVEVGSGLYELPGTINLTSTDGGKDSLSQVIYRAEKGAMVRLSGGHSLTKWELVSDKKTLQKFSTEVGNKIYQTDLRRAGISDFGSPAGDGAELFFNDKPMSVSRYPNKGFIKITGLLNEDPIDVRGTKGDKVGKIRYDDQRIALWKNETDPWVHGYWFWDWSEQRHKIAKIDTQKRIIEVVPPYHNFGYRTGQWFYGFNLLSEIDEPGEYYIDRTKGILYFYPPSPIEKGDSYISMNKNCIEMNKVSYLTMQGIIIEGCRESAVNMEDCNHSILKGCTIRNMGGWAVVIKGGTQNGAQGCDIYNAGAGGIRIDAGDRKTLLPAACFADNNYIHHIARLKRVYNPGIDINGAGNRISHNLIAHVPHMAVGFLGNNHLIELNEIDDVCFESNDAGAIYTGRDWTMRGNIIRYNYLHNISGFEGKGCVGIYLDDGFSSADITGNIFNKVTRATMIGGGRDNKITNNIFVNCDPSIYVDARGLGWMKELTNSWIREANDKGTLSGINYNQPPYLTQYPKLATILNNEPAAPNGNIISHNICSGGMWDKNPKSGKSSIEKRALPYLTIADNIISLTSEVADSLTQSTIIANPQFVNEENPEQGKFQLNTNSPALTYGFMQIPFDKIGLYQNDNRASWPVPEK